MKKTLALLLGLIFILCSLGYAEDVEDVPVDILLTESEETTEDEDADAADDASETEEAEATDTEAEADTETEEAETSDAETEDEDVYADDDDDIDLTDLLTDGLITVEDYAVTEDLPDDWWNILLLGTDNRYDTEEGSYSRTDTMIILSINLSTKEAKLTSIMRDTWVSMYGRSSKAKLNAAAVYGGPELTMRTINESFGMNITDYALINITGLAEVIDILGGLDLDVTEAERDALNKGLFDLSSQSGMEELEDYGEGVHLNGNQAVAYARIRQIDSDYKRTERQRYVLTEIARKLQDSNDATTIISVITNLLPYVETNLDLTELMTLAYVGLELDVDGIEQFRIPADGTYESGTFDGVWCIKPDFDENTELLYEFIYGDDDDDE